MKLKLTAVAVLATFAIGAQAASTPISSGPGAFQVNATIDNNGSFDIAGPIGMNYNGVEFVNIDTRSAWWGFGNTSSGYTVAQYGSVIPGSTTYPAGTAATTTIALGTLSFFQTITAVSSNQLAVTASFTNNGKETLKGFYYGVGFDPDQSGSGLNSTFNTVNAQGNGASVTAGAWNGGLYYTVTLGNTTSASATAIAAYVNKGDCCSFVDPQSVLSSPLQAGFQGFADDSISLAYALGDIAVGQTVSVGYNYVFAAVPEPETYALFMAGLGLMGFVARRRIRA